MPIIYPKIGFIILDVFSLIYGFYQFYKFFKFSSYAKTDGTILNSIYEISTTTTSDGMDADAVFKVEYTFSVSGKTYVGNRFIV